MSIPSVTRQIDDPPGWIDVTFKNIEPAWIQQFPLDTDAGGKILFYGTRRSFEAYTPNSSKDHKTFKAFEHYKAETNWAHGLKSTGILISADLEKGNRLLSIANTHDDRLFNQYTGAGPPGQFNDGLTSWYVPRADGGFIPAPDDLELLKKRSLQTMSPKIKADLSGLVSLYEAKDILSIRGTLKSVTKLSKNLFSKFRGLHSKSLSAAVAHQAADGYLQWMFNLKPLISDIGGIYRAIATYERRVNEFVNRSGTIQTTHFKCDLKELLGTVNGSFGAPHPVGGHPLGFVLSSGINYGLGSWLTNARTIVTDSAVFRATMQYNYTLSAYQKEHAKVLGLLDALGVNFNPSYVWKVLPWSFVVDWVVNVGSWLDQFEVKNMEPKVNILQYCWSVKKVRRIAVYARVTTQKYYSGYSNGTYGVQQISLPEIRETSYRRGIDYPSNSSFTTSGLNSTELSLGAALLITRRRRNTKK